MLRSYNGKIFAIDEHFERFANSLKAIEITGVDIEPNPLEGAKGFDKAGIANAKIYFHITRGSGIRDHLPIGRFEAQFLFDDYGAQG